MTDLSNFLPIRVENLDTIIARIDADLNAGLAPDDDAFIDTTPGTFYADIRTAFALELERLWDVATTDTVAASLIEYAWGVYLDAHGAPLGVGRNDEARATGTVTFTGDNGTLIATGIETSTIQVDPEDEPIAFVTTESGTIGASPLTLAVEAVEPGVSGNVATGAVTLLTSPVTGVTSVANDAAMSGGVDVESDESYRDRLKLSWSAAQGAGSVADYQRWSLDVDGVGFVRVTPIWNGAGTVRVVITDTENNPVSATLLQQVQDLLDPYDAETAVNGGDLTTPIPTLTVDSTTGFAAAGQIYVGDQLVAYTGTTGTTFTGCTGFTANITDGDAVVQSGSGNGLAPVGAIVSVRTAATLTIDVDAELTVDDGYSVDGASGTISVLPEVTSILTEYINNLPPGGEPAPGVDTGAGSVLYFRVFGLLMGIPGVYAVTDLLLDAVAADKAVTANEVPEIGTLTVTETP